MKKIIATLALISLLAVPVISFAGPVNEGATEGATPIPEATDTFTSPGGLIAKINDIGNWIFTGLLALAAIFLVVAGYFFVTAGGNPENVNKARLMLINALIGVAVGVASKGLAAVIQGIVKG